MSENPSRRFRITARRSPNRWSAFSSGREAMRGRGIRELVTLVPGHVQNGTVQQRRQAIPGQLPADLPFVDQRLVVLNSLR